MVGVGFSVLSTEARCSPFVSGINLCSSDPSDRTDQDRSGDQIKDRTGPDRFRAPVKDGYILKQKLTAATIINGYNRGFCFLSDLDF